MEISTILTSRVVPAEMPATLVWMSFSGLVGEFPTASARFRRLARDYERLATTLAGYHWLAFAMLMLKSLFAKSA
jgi:hypothetical protein